MLVNIDKARGIVGLSMAWIHTSRRANRSHAAIHPEMLGES